MQPKLHARSVLLRVPGRFCRSSDWLCWHRRYHVQGNSGGPEVTAALQSDATADRRTKPASTNPGDSRLLQLRALYRLQGRRRSLSAVSPRYSVSLASGLHSSQDASDIVADRDYAGLDCKRRCSYCIFFRSLKAQAAAQTKTEGRMRHSSAARTAVEST